MASFFKKSAQKQYAMLPEKIQAIVLVLVREIENLGPIRNNWKNFGKLKMSGDVYHCHVKSRRPTYVICWELIDKKIKIVEVYYVGTHEKAPY